MNDSADQDLRDVFKLLYDDGDWAFDDEDTTQDTVEKIISEPEVDKLETDLDDSVGSHLERYSRKRFMGDLNELLGPNNKRQRIYSPMAGSTSSYIIPCTAPIPPIPSSSTYAPFSPLPLLARLRSFEISSWSPYIPFPLDSVQAALYGWVNEGRDTLLCGVCGAKWDLGGVAEIRDERVRIEVARRLVGGLGNKHRKDCSWRVRRSPDALYSQLRRYLHSPVTSNLSLLAAALERECIGPANTNFSWSSPLTTSQSDQLSKRLDLSNKGPCHPTETESLSSIIPTLSPFAATLALFCWYPFHPDNDSQSISPDSILTRKTDIVQCRLCERRVGLWTFRSNSKQGEKKIFDLVEEHLEWCPIRDHIGEVKWWEDLPLLRHREKGDAGKISIAVSEKMEVKPWRKVRG